MFKKYYKEANDDIKTNRELINKIFEEAEKPAKPKQFAKIYKFGMAAAAVLVLAVSVSFLPNIMKNSGQPGTSNMALHIAHSDANKTDANKKSETTQPVETTEKAETQAEEGVQPIKPIEKETNDNTSEDTPILAIETGEQQGFAISRGRMVEEPSTVNEYSVAVADWQEPTQAESDMIARFFVDKYGEKDSNTGFVYSFYTEGKAEVDGETVYFVRMRWLTNDVNWSTISTFVINEDMTELYDSIFPDEKTVYWSTASNLIE